MFLSLDVGTSSCKAMIFDIRGRRHAMARANFQTQTPRPGWIELNPNTIWISLHKAIRTVASKKIQAIAVTAFGDGLIPLSKKGKPLYNIISALDLRAIKQNEKLLKKVGPKEIFMITGQHLHPMHIVNKINWLRDNNQTIFRKTSKFLQTADFINYKLTGNLVTDLTLASRTGVFDISKKRWSEKLSNDANISLDYLPEAKEPGKVIGQLDPMIAKQVGLSKDTEVVLGGHDSSCAAFGAGLIKKRMGLDVAGTWEILRVIVEHPVLNETMFNLGISNYCPVTKDTCLLGGAYPSGAIINWYLSFLREQGSKISIQTLIRKMPKSPSTVFILPHFAGSGTPHWDPSSRGAILGLHLGVTGTDVFKAVLESLAFELAMNIKFLKQGGIEVNQLRAGGGGADKSVIQLKADITGKILSSLKEPEVSSLGASMLAGLGVKQYSSPTDAVHKAVKLEKQFYPRPSVNKLYRSRLEIFSEIYPLLRNFNKGVSGLQSNSQP